VTTAYRDGYQKGFKAAEYDDTGATKNFDREEAWKGYKI
jgi:hypothetical protein